MAIAYFWGKYVYTHKNVLSLLKFSTTSVCKIYFEVFTNYNFKPPGLLLNEKKSLILQKLVQCNGNLTCTVHLEIYEKADLLFLL